MKSFETAAKLVTYLFDYFQFDPLTVGADERAPVVVFLVGNKADLYPDKDSVDRPPTERHVRNLLQTQIGKHLISK